MIFVFFLSCSNAVAQDYQYCKKADFSDRCVAANANDELTCAPIRAAAAADCTAYMESVPGKMSALFYDLVDQAVTAISGALVLLLGGLAVFFRKQAANLKKRLLDPFFAKSTRYESLGLNVLMVGKGGSGKTSLIRALSGSEDANPNRKTTSNALYSLAHEVTVKVAAGEKRRLLRIFMSDHVGQDFATISQTAFYKREELAPLPKCIVFVVDIFPANERFGEDRKFAKPNEERIATLDGVFNEDSIRQITGAIEQAATIVLFINKLDKLTEIGEKTDSLVKGLYTDLIERLRTIPGEVFVIAGSAKTGLRIVGSDVDGGGPRSELTLYGVLLGAAGPAKF